MHAGQFTDKVVQAFVLTLQSGDREDNLRSLGNVQTGKNLLSSCPMIRIELTGVNTIRNQKQLIVRYPEFSRLVVCGSRQNLGEVRAMMIV